MLILGIETSCDETAAGIISDETGKLEVLSNIVSSQVKLHAQWGGVVPNLAAREHLNNILPVIQECLTKAKIKPSQLDAIAVTQGPGLIPALLIGVNAAKTLAYLWQKPLLGIHHIEGHIYANFIESSSENRKFPVLALVVSGGHTQLVLMKKHLSYEIIGETLDDAAGEAFDKVARILGLGYPGGPAVAKRAKYLLDTSYQLLDTKLPRPMLNSQNFNFSFSGLKTAVLYLVKKNENLMKNQQFVNEICHEFQQAVIDVLIHKTISAAKVHQSQTITLAGGVSANLELRQQLGAAIKKELKNTAYMIPDLSYSLDNATMIATAGYFRWKTGKGRTQYQENWKKISADANLKLA